MTHFNNAAKEWDSPEKIERSKCFGDAIKKYLSFHRPISVLDIGCGTGLLSYQFAPTKEILGVDTSEGMLEVFEEKAKKVPGSHSLLIDLEKEELNTKSRFDLIVSSLAFHHLHDPASMLKKLKSTLSNEGLFAIIDLDKEDGSFHANPSQMGVKHFGFAEKELKRWAIDAGLRLSHREIIFAIHKNNRSYPVFLAIFAH